MLFVPNSGNLILKLAYDEDLIKLKSESLSWLSSYNILHLNIRI